MGSPSLPTMSLQKLFSHQQPDNQKVHSYSGYILSFKLLDNKGYNQDIVEAGLRTSPIPLKSKGEFSFNLLQIFLVLFMAFLKTTPFLKIHWRYYN